LLLSIASPQSEQCRIGGRGGAGIWAALKQRSTLFAEFARMQIGPAQGRGKGAENGDDERYYDDLCWH